MPHACDCKQVSLLASPSGSLPSRPFPFPPHKKAQRAHAPHSNSFAPHYTHSYGQAGETIVYRQACVRHIGLGVVWAMEGGSMEGRVSTPRKPHVYPTQTHATSALSCHAPFLLVPFLIQADTHTPTPKSPPPRRLFHGQDRLRTWFGRAGKLAPRRWRPLGTQFASTRPWSWYFGRGVCNAGGEIMRTRVRKWKE